MDLESHIKRKTRLPSHENRWLRISLERWAFSLGKLWGAQLWHPLMAAPMGSQDPLQSTPCDHSSPHPPWHRMLCRVERTRSQRTGVPWLGKIHAQKREIEAWNVFTLWGRIKLPEERMVHQTGSLKERSWEKREVGLRDGRIGREELPAEGLNG